MQTGRNTIGPSRRFSFSRRGPRSARVAEHECWPTLVDFRYASHAKRPKHLRPADARSACQLRRAALRVFGQRNQANRIRRLGPGTQEFTAQQRTRSLRRRNRGVLEKPGLERVRLAHRVASHRRMGQPDEVWSNAEEGRARLRLW